MRELIKRLESAGYEHSMFEEEPAIKRLKILKSKIANIEENESEINLYFKKKLPLTFK